MGCEKVAPSLHRRLLQVEGVLAFALQTEWGGDRPVLSFLLAVAVVSTEQPEPCCCILFPNTPVTSVTALHLVRTSSITN